jgi:prevent-host-death family protein
MSVSIGAFEAKTRLSELLQRVEAGEQVTITKHGRPVARLVPIREDASTRDWESFWEDVDRRLAPSTGLVSMKADIENGRL